MPTHPTTGQTYPTHVALLAAEERTQTSQCRARQLSFLQREIARLHDSGRRVRDIAAIVGVGTSTIYYHLDLVRRARRFSEISEKYS